MASQSVARSESIAARHLAGLYGVGDKAGFDERPIERRAASTTWASAFASYS
jgi:hypothetical protein